MRLFILRGSVLVAFFFCGLPVGFSSAPEVSYDQVYPYYVEVTAVSRLRRLGEPENNASGWGHVLMYLKGACIDPSAPYPKIRLCQEGEGDIHSPETGVGVSVDKMFKTVNWIAVPGKQLLYYGNLAAGDRLTSEHFDATVREVVKQDLVRGIEFHKEYTTSKPAEQSMPEFVAEKIAATDYAVAFARSNLIARVPVTQEQVGRMVDYLNTRNEEVFSGKAAFNWSAYHDNCAHTVHNALAAAGLWGAKSINQYRIKQLFNMAVPANEFADLAFLTKDRPGALLEIIRAHEPNDLFDTTYKLYVAEGPFRKATTNRIRKMLADPRHTDLEANLLYHKGANV